MIACACWGIQKKTPSFEESAESWQVIAGHAGDQVMLQVIVRSRKHVLDQRVVVIFKCACVVHHLPPVVALIALLDALVVVKWDYQSLLGTA